MTTNAVDWMKERHSERNPMHMANDMAPRIPHIEKYNNVDNVHRGRPHTRKHPPNANTTNTRLTMQDNKINKDNPNKDVSYECSANPSVKYTYASTISEMLCSVLCTISGGRTIDPYANRPTMPEMPTYSHNAYTIRAMMKCTDGVCIFNVRTTRALHTPTAQAAHMKAIEIPTARTGTQRFNC